MDYTSWGTLWRRQRVRGGSIGIDRERGVAIDDGIGRECEGSVGKECGARWHRQGEQSCGKEKSGALQRWQWREVALHSTTTPRSGAKHWTTPNTILQKDKCKVPVRLIEDGIQSKTYTIGIKFVLRRTQTWMDQHQENHFIKHQACSRHGQAQAKSSLHKEPIDVLHTLDLPRVKFESHRSEMTGQNQIGK